MAIKRGDKLTIVKGTALWSTNPSKRRFLAGRTYQIKVHDVYHWPANAERAAYSEVVWSGAAGYWTYANIEDVVTQPDSALATPPTEETKSVG